MRKDVEPIPDSSTAVRFARGIVPDRRSVLIFKLSPPLPLKNRSDETLPAELHSPTLSPAAVSNTISRADSLSTITPVRIQFHAIQQAFPGPATPPATPPANPPSNAAATAVFLILLLFSLPA